MIVTSTWIMDEEINMLSHHVFLFLYHTTTHLLFILWSPSSLRLISFPFRTPLQTCMCGGNSWQYWHQSWMHFATNTLPFVQWITRCADIHTVLTLSWIKWRQYQLQGPCPAVDPLLRLRWQRKRSIEYHKKIISWDIFHLYTFVSTLLQYQECHL